MRRIQFLCIVSFILLLLGLVIHKSSLLALTIPFIIYICSGVFFAPAEISLTVKRKLSGSRILHGSTVEVALTITNTGCKLEEIRIEDFLPHGIEVVDGENGALTVLRKGASKEIRYKLRVKRGFYLFDRISVTVCDYLGLIRKSSVFTAPGEITAVPDIRKLKDFPINPRKTLVFAGSNFTRLGGHGVQFFDIREYQPGDSLRHVNWRVLGRHPDKIFTNEFEQERVADIGIILDSRMKASTRSGRASIFEFSVQAAAALAETFLASHNRVGLLIYGSEMNWTFPGYGKYQREKILTTLARASEGAHQVFEELDSLPVSLFPPQSQIVFISPLLSGDADFLTRLRSWGYALTVISPDPVIFESRILPSLKSAVQQEALTEGRTTTQRVTSPAAAPPTTQRVTPPPTSPANKARDLAGRIAVIERRLLIRKLEQAGIFVLNWDVRKSFDSAVLSEYGRMRVWLQHRGRL